MDQTDEELVRECLAGDSASYGVLVRRHYQRVVAVAYRALRDGALAEDLAQEVFLRAYRSLRRFEPSRRFRPWLMAITANRIRDFFSTRARRGQIAWELDPIAKAGESTPLDRAQARQMLARGDEAVALMPEETREVLRLRFVLGLDYDDVAETLGIPLGTVKSRISRARVSLRETLGEVL